MYSGVFVCYDRVQKNYFKNKPIYQSGVMRVLNGEKDNLNGIIFQRVN